MLKPIPARILTHNITLAYAPVMDAWGNIGTQLVTSEDQDVLTSRRLYFHVDGTPVTIDVSHVCVQPVNETRKTKDNTEVDLVGICFVDARLSTPANDYWALKDEAEAIGGDLKLIYDEKIFTVKTVDRLVDDTGALHHWELGLI